MEATANQKPPAEKKVSVVVERNVEALLEHRRREEAKRKIHGRIADGVTRFAGSSAFIYLHLLLFAAWFVINRGWTPIAPFDDTFYLLGTVASVEAIFLSTFVLITQNRMADLAEKRAELDLHISLLSEHEITRLLKLVTQIAGRLNVKAADDPELDELKRDVHPEAVLDHMDERREKKNAEQS